MKFRNCKISLEYIFPLENKAHVCSHRFFSPSVHTFSKSQISLGLKAPETGFCFQNRSDQYQVTVTICIFCSKISGFSNLDPLNLHFSMATQTRESKTKFTNKLGMENLIHSKLPVHNKIWQTYFNSNNLKQS